MRPWRTFLSAFLFILLISFSSKSTLSSTNGTRTFLVRGLVEDVNVEKQLVVVRHEAITNFMDAMTMPFKVRNQDELSGLRRGDEVTFQLHVTDTESWVDQFSNIGKIEMPALPAQGAALADPKYELLHYPFTNELGQAVSLSDFPGQALAITFFYTRCPLPDYCPRLSKNFQMASQRLEAMSGAPTNWHFLSCSFDTEFDTPPMLLAYGQSYQYDPAHWSFLTGPSHKMSELARASGVTIAADGATFNHNFRTLIIDASGHLQMVFPTSGDLSDQIVAEIIKAAGAKNPVAAQAQNR